MRKDINLNTGPIHDNYQLKKKENKGLHFIHWNIHSLLPKTDKLKEIAKISNKVIICITESKLDNWINNSKVWIECYSLIWHAQNWKSGGEVCYASSNIFCKTKICILNKIKNIFIDSCLSKIKPLIVGIKYKPKDQLKRPITLPDSLEILNILWGILGPFGQWVSDFPYI